MASKTVTVVLGEATVDRIRALVAAGSTPSVSAFVRHAVGLALDESAEWSDVLRDALARTGGPLSDDERAWADAVLGVSH